MRPPTAGFLKTSHCSTQSFTTNPLPFILSKKSRPTNSPNSTSSSSLSTILLFRTHSNLRPLFSSPIPRCLIWSPEGAVRILKLVQPTDHVSTFVLPPLKLPWLQRSYSGHRREPPYDFYVASGSGSSAWKVPAGSQGHPPIILNELSSEEMSSIVEQRRYREAGERQRAMGNVGLGLAGGGVAKKESMAAEDVKKM